MSLYGGWGLGSLPSAGHRLLPLWGAGHRGGLLGLRLSLLLALRQQVRQVRDGTVRAVLYVARLVLPEVPQGRVVASHATVPFLVSRQLQDDGEPHWMAVP